MLNPRALRLLSCVGAVLMLFTACSSATPSPTAVATAAPQPKAASTPAAPAAQPTSVPTKAAAQPTAVPTVARGKELIVAVGNFGQDVLDPILLAGSPAQDMLQPIFDSFIRVDTEAHLVPGVFTSWKPSADGTYWTFEMRRGVKFHGTWGEATAEDAKFSIERYLSAESIYKGPWANLVTKAEVVDPYTVRVYTKKPDPSFAVEISQFNTVPVMYLMPKRYIEERGAEAFRTQPIGSGPYQFKSHTAGSAVEYTAFNGYWENKPGYESLKVLLIPQENARVGLLRQGGAQIAVLSPDSVQDVKRAGFDARGVPASNQTTLLLYGTYYDGWKGKPTADVRVRKALSLAINRQEMIDALLQGSTVPSAAGVTASSQDFDSAKWSRAAAEAYKYDPQEAKRLLGAAGLPNGFEISLYAYQLSGAPLPQLAEALAGYWEKIGVKTKLVPIDWAGFAPMRDAEPQPPNIMGQASIHRYMDQPNLAMHQNWFYYGNKSLNRLLNNAPNVSAMPDIDRELDALGSEFDPTRRQEKLDQVMAKTTETYTAIPLAEVAQFFGFDPKVDLDVRPFSQIGPRVVDAKPKR